MLVLAISISGIEHFPDSVKGHLPEKILIIFPSQHALLRFIPYLLNQ